MEVVLLVLALVLVAVGVFVIRSRRNAPDGGSVPSIPSQRGPGRELVPTNNDAPSLENQTAFVLDDGAGGQLFAELIDPTDSVLWARADRGGNHEPSSTLEHVASSVALDRAIETLPYIGAAVQGGKWVRILNPEALELGTQIKSHAGGFLAGIYGPDKKFAAQLRFSSPQDLAQLATPMAVFKVASAITGQYYLNRINSQLMTIEGQVRQIRQELRNETYGEITSAAEACLELEEGLALSLDLTHDEHLRLVISEDKIDEAYKHKLKDVQDFLDDIDKLFSAEKMDRKEIQRLLLEAQSTRFFDLQLLAYGAAVRHKLNLLRAQVDQGDADGRGKLAQRKLDRELEDMREDLCLRRRSSPGLPSNVTRLGRSGKSKGGSEARRRSSTASPRPGVQ